MHQAKKKTALLFFILLAGTLWLGTQASHAIANTVGVLSDGLAWQGEADALMNQGKYREAAELYIRAIPIFESRHLKQDVAVLRHQLAFSLVGAGDDAGALEHFEANRTYHQAAGHKDAAANYTLYIAQSYARLNNHHRALSLFEEARAFFSGKPERLAEIDHWRVISLEQLGQIRRAISVVDEAAHSLSPALWQLHLAEDSKRLRTLPLDAETSSFSPRWLSWLGIGCLTAVLVWTGVRYRRFRNVLTNGLLVSASILVTLSLVEAFLRATENHESNIRHLLHPPNQQVRFMPKPGVMPGVGYDESIFTTNEAGLRAGPLPRSGALRILAVGGSSTEALFLDDRDAWPYLLQEELRPVVGRDLWVGNAGKSGLSSISHVVQLYFQLVELRPDIVLLTAGINDLNQCVSGGLQAIIDNARFMRKPTFPLEYRQYVFDRILLEEPVKQWRVLELWQQVQENLKQPNKFVTSRFNYVVQDKAGEFYVEQRRRRQLAEKRDATPDIQTCVAAFEDNLRRTATMTKKQGTQLILATQGSLYRDDLSADEEALLWFGAVNKNPFSPEPPRQYYTASAMAKMLSEYNAATMRVCASEQLICLDTDAALPKTSASYYDDVHLNVQGSHALAKAFAKLLLENAIVTPKNDI